MVSGGGGHGLESAEPLRPTAGSCSRERLHPAPASEQHLENVSGAFAPHPPYRNYVFFHFVFFFCFLKKESLETYILSL